MPCIRTRKALRSCCRAVFSQAAQENHRAVSNSCMSLCWHLLRTLIPSRCVCTQLLETKPHSVSMQRITCALPQPAWDCPFPGWQSLEEKQCTQAPSKQESTDPGPASHSKVEFLVECTCVVAQTPLTEIDTPAPSPEVEDEWKVSPELGSLMNSPWLGFRPELASIP